jgi:hypothetical protein
LVKSLLKEASGLFREGFNKDICHTTKFSVSQLSEAVKFYNMGEAKGSITIDLSGDENVPIIPSKPPPLQLNAQSCYILAGGLGSLGFRIAKLMARHGAKHLVLLSRSGGGKSKYDEDIRMLTELGCRIDVLTCDVTKAQDVENAVATLRNNGAKISGVIQCAMVLRVSPFSLPQILPDTQCETTGQYLCKHDIRTMARVNQPQSNRYLEPPRLSTKGHGLFHHAIFRRSHYG